MPVDWLDKRCLRHIVAVTSIAVLLLPGTVVFAGILAADGNAMPGWHGTQPFHGTWPGEITPPQFHADVDYAVYAPGQFGLSFPPDQDPSGGADYVYAYQIFNTGLFGDQPIIQLTVGLDGDEVVGNIGSIGAGQAPVNESFQGLPPTSAAWFYDQNSLPPGNPDPQTNILIYTSLAGPEPNSSTLLGQMVTADVQDLPSPVPEPATLILLSVAAAALLLFRPVRRRSMLR